MRYGFLPHTSCLNGLFMENEYIQCQWISCLGDSIRPWNDAITAWEQGRYFIRKVKMSKKVLVVEDKPGKQPLSRAKKTTREGTGFRVAGGNIAAIDFGTTFVSVAYCTEGNDSILTIKLDDTKQLDRVPNAILLCREFEGTQHEVHSIGYRAQDAYPRLRPQDKMNYVYIERIKMLMRRDEVSNTGVPIILYFQIKIQPSYQ